METLINDSYILSLARLLANWTLRLISPPLVLLATGGLIGCASVKVDPNSVKFSGRFPTSGPIYVQSFATEQGEWKVDRDGAELEAFKAHASAELQKLLVERLPEITTTLPVPDHLPQEGLLITGTFTRVNQGSRALRMGIGFGAGATKVETEVLIYDLKKSSTDPICSFKTTGGSNAQPGFVLAPVTAIGAAAATGANATGLTADWERTSREIRNFLIARFQLSERMVIPARQNPPQEKSLGMATPDTRTDPVISTNPG